MIRYQSTVAKTPAAAPWLVIGYWSLVIRCCVCAALGLLVAGCSGGGDNAPTGPKETSLEGERAKRQPPADHTPAVDLGKAPTETHRALAKLLTAAGLIRDSVLYGGWDAGAADLGDEAPENALLPCLSAKYLSTSYKIESGGDDSKTATQDYPQSATLIIIQAPEAAATEPIARGIYQRLLGLKFAQSDPVELAFGKGEGNQLRMERFLRIDAGAEKDTVLVGYVATIGDLVVYALEVEEPPRIVGPGDTQIKRVTNDQRGTRVGAQLISMVHHLRG